MENLVFLNKKEIGFILEKIKEQFGLKELNLDYVFLKNKENKIFIANKDLDRIDLKRLRINSIGLYFCKIEKNWIRLTVEGSQIIGKFARTNVLELNKNQLKEWIIGNNLDVKGSKNSCVIVKHEHDYFGSGLVKENILINYFPKTRRLKVINE